MKIRRGINEGDPSGRGRQPFTPQAFLSSQSYGLTPELDLKARGGGNDIVVPAVSCSPPLRARQYPHLAWLGQR